MKYPLLLIALALAGCPSSSGEEGVSSTGGEDYTGGTTGSASSSTGVDPSGSTSSSGGGSGDSSSSTGGDSSSSSDSSSFIETTGPICDNLPDGVLAHCSLCSYWRQDCGEGDACKPWANDGQDVWNSPRCGPVSEDPGQPGEACDAEDSGFSGIDSCDVDAFCWNVDAKSNQGECVALCGGSQESPECAEGTACVIANDEALTLCLPTCDPLAPDCDEGEGCYPGSDEDFVCVREGDPVTVDGLEHAACPAGSLATDEDTCAQFCDLSAETPCDEGSVCSPYLEAGGGDVGICLPA